VATVTTFVVDEADVESVREDGDTASVRITFDASNGSEHLEQRVVRFGAGRSRERKLDGRQEVLFVVAGQGRLALDGQRHELEPETAAFVASGETYSVENPGPGDLLVVSVAAPAGHNKPDVHERKVTVRLADQPEQPASSERTFRYLVDESAGCFEVTQFVGTVQPSKAPMHSHPYDELGYVLDGEGIAHVGGRSTPLRPGSCFHLPPNEVHCIENTGASVMRIVGVFHPSGSPASREYEDNK
jgi:mannose-6-phosphate isomerase-like protein (cupin superfamily)